MPHPISPISTTPILPPRVASVESRPNGDFQSVLTDAVHGVESLRHTANRSVETFLAGEGEELHRTVLATQRAELAFDLFLQVRNKVAQAYQEIMRMQM
jgi:flagellar hook-basal body complex protein FliE